MPPLPADSIHARACKLKCEKILTRPHGQLHNGKLAGVSFGYGKGAACWPRLGGWCLVFRFWLDNVCPEVGECSAICCFLLSSHLKSVQNCLDKYKRSRNIHKNLDAHQYYN